MAYQLTALQLPAQGLALEQFGHRVGNVTLAAEVEDFENVRMGQLGDRLGFALEAGQAVGVLGQRLGQDLDRHVSIKPLVVGPVDLSHAARAERRGDLVRTDLRAGLQAHDRASILNSLDKRTGKGQVST